MKKTIIIMAVCTLTSCTSKDTFRKGKHQLELQGYTNIKNTGYSLFCCDEKDTFFNGFIATDKDGNITRGCFCGGFLKGVTIRFE